jgi:hypothetical protein
MEWLFIAECYTFKSIGTHTICGMQKQRQSRMTLPLIVASRNAVITSGAHLFFDIIEDARKERCTHIREAV